MKTKSLLVLCFLGAMALLAVLLLGPEEGYLRTPIYDETLDAPGQIADALKRATQENKRVLLQFGANWCGWCHVLHRLFETNQAVHQRIQAGFIVVLVDVNQGHNESTVEKYGQPTRFGLPAIVVLDADGRQLDSPDVGGFGENGGYSPQKVSAFLDKWSPNKSQTDGRLKRP